MHDSKVQSGAAQLKRWLAHCLLSADDLQPVAVGVEQALLAIAQGEGVSELLAHRAQYHDLGFSADFRAQLQRLEHARVATGLRRQQELALLLEGLQREGIPSLLLKGEALAHTLYAQPYLRARTDVDLLFAHKDDAERAWQLLSQRGYQRRPTLQGRFVGFQYQCTLEYAPGAFMQFDLHNQCSDYVWFANQLTFAEMLSASVSCTIDGQPAHCPDTAHALLHACMHRVANKPYGTKDRLIWLYDIHLLVQELVITGRWDQFHHLVVGKRMARICLDAIACGVDWFCTEVDLRALRAAAAAEAPGLSTASSRRSLFLADLRLNAGLGNKLIQLREHLFPAPRYMMARYQLPSVLLVPPYYLVRLLSGLWSGFSRVQPGTRVSSAARPPAR